MFSSFGDESAYGVPNPTQAGTPEDVEEKGKGWTLKSNTDYSSIPCAEGSTDAGTYTHPTQGFIIRLCNTNLKKVASINSQNIVNMIKAAEESGITLGASTSFRSYEEQQRLYNQNCSSGTCNPPTAQPGNSMHERGLATDFNNSGRGGIVYEWLSKNASSFGYYNYPPESWHWSTTGG
jgi:LAS superfamily LD-carboxypeptidase LdcB